VPTKTTTPGRPAPAKRAKTTPRTAAATRRRTESGPQRAQRESEDEFRALLSNHIRDMRRRGVTEDVLGPFERELLRLGPASVKP
jgi:hypothetical protein